MRVAWCTLALVACARPAPLPSVVALPDSIPTVEVVEIAAPGPPPPCPPDTTEEPGGLCVRVVASPEIPVWKPRAASDPCGAWVTSDRGLVDCDPRNDQDPEAHDGGGPATRIAGKPRR